MGSTSTPALFFFLYLMRLRSGRIYVGVTSQLPTRLRDHTSYRGCATTRHDPPVRLLYLEPHSTLSSARLREAQLKRWSCAKKLALARGDHDALRRLAGRRPPTEDR
jgi:predicted GIY-YIG superfamily endonuclease